MQLMKSADGGFTYVYSITDVERLEGYGWRKADPSEQVKPGKEVAPVEVAPEVGERISLPEGWDAPKKKPGRPKAK